MSRYTNFVLTLIAMCLVVLVVKAIFESPVAYADPLPTTSSVQKVNIVEIGGYELLSRSALPVEIQRTHASGNCGCP